MSNVQPQTVSDGHLIGRPKTPSVFSRAVSIRVEHSFLQFQQVYSEDGFCFMAFLGYGIYYLY
jgi:hypothetical protein